MKTLLATIALFLFTGCVSDQSRIIDEIKEAVVEAAKNPIPSSGGSGAMGEPVQSSAFEYIAMMGAVISISGVLVMVASIMFSGMPMISRLKKGGQAAILSGLGMATIGYMMPRYSYIVERHIAQYLIYYVGVVLILGLWVSSIIAVRKLTWVSAHRIGFEEGKDYFKTTDLEQFSKIIKPEK